MSWGWIRFGAVGRWRRQLRFAGRQAAGPGLAERLTFKMQHNAPIVLVALTGHLDRSRAKGIS
jgi:hypothetical protein